MPFSAHLSGQETHALRRWLLGAEGQRRGAGRIRGLKRRVEDLIQGDMEMQGNLDEALGAARALAGEGWHRRLSEGRESGR